MQIEKLSIENFRAKEKLDMHFGNRLTLLVGENGSGKTTILDAIAIALGAILTHLPKASGISFKKTDLRQIANIPSPYTRIKLETKEGLIWDRTEKRDKSRQTSIDIPPAIGLVNLRQYLDEKIINPFNNGLDFQLPIFSYYGVSRALLDVPLRRRGFPKTHLRFEAYENALNAASRFKSAFVWFYNKENEENRLQRNMKSFEYKLPELEAVRNAITKMFPDISNPHVMLSPLRFAVDMKGETLDIMQLSDGYKTLLSLVIDLASRMALANPKMKNPLDARAVVLIDEVDLHLHPEWQRRITGDLLKTFPAAQFIITTHSPYIVEAINNHLQRHHIAGMSISDTEIETTAQLSPDDVVAYHITGNEEEPLMDQELKLLDDKLIHPFNSLAGLYDRMRDIQWENRSHD